MKMSRQMSNFLSILIISLLAAACSQRDAPVNSKSGDDSGSGVIPAHQLKTLQRAKDTEAMLLEKDRQRQQQLHELQ